MNTSKKSESRFSGLSCPLDGMSLRCMYDGLKPAQLRCADGHTFDISRQGYANLLTVQEKRSKDPGDTRLMIDARGRVLDSGIYLPIANRLSEILIRQLVHFPASRPLSCQPLDIRVLDAGCGDGYYLGHCMEALCRFYEGSAIGLDISKWAVMAATKRSNTITWLVGSNRNPPIEPQSIDVIICGFGFPVFSAFMRILKPGGMIIMLDPGAHHLLELRKIIYPVIKPFRQADFLDAIQLGYSIADTEKLEYTTWISRQQIQDILVMSPHLYKATNEAREAAFAFEGIDVTIDVNYAVLRL